MSNHNNSSISNWMLSNVGVLVLDLAIKNMGSLRIFLREEAQKTTNRMDDMLVDIVVDYLSDYLEDLRDGL